MEHGAPPVNSLEVTALGAVDNFETETLYKFTQQYRKKLLETSSRTLNLENPTAIGALLRVNDSMLDAALKRDKGKREDREVDSHQVIAEATSLLVNMYKTGDIPINPDQTKGPEGFFGELDNNDGDVQDWELSLEQNDEDLPTFKRKMGVEDKDL